LSNSYKKYVISRMLAEEHRLKILVYKFGKCENEVSFLLSNSKPLLKKHRVAVMSLKYA